jgi:hypothetical protein
VSEVTRSCASRVRVADTLAEAPGPMAAGGDDGTDGTGRRELQGVDVRVREAGAVVVAVLLLAGCGTGGDEPSASASATSPKPSASTAEPAPTSASPSSSAIGTATPEPSMSTSSPTSQPVTALVDYGAVLSVWAKHHVADERFDPGAMWDPTPGLGPGEDDNDRYNNLDASTGRVLAYTVYLARGGVSSAKATAAVLTALPRDATVLWRQQFAACSVVQLTSASLAKAVAGTSVANPRGQVQLVLRSGSPTAPPAVPRLDTAKVTHVEVSSALAATPQDFTGC